MRRQHRVQPRLQLQVVGAVIHVDHVAGRQRGIDDDRPAYAQVFASALDTRSTSGSVTANSATVCASSAEISAGDVSPASQDALSESPAMPQPVLPEFRRPCRGQPRQFDGEVVEIERADRSRRAARSPRELRLRERRAVPRPRRLPAAATMRHPPCRARAAAWRSCGNAPPIADRSRYVGRQRRARASQPADDFTPLFGCVQIQQLLRHRVSKARR